MQVYSEKQIRKLHTEFSELKRYTDKLSFFDSKFGIIPFIFPEFDAQLEFFFRKGKTDELINIYKKERNNPGLTRKNFQFKENFAFNIKPANSNSAVYSNFILSSFLSRAPDFAEWLKVKKTEGIQIESLLEESNGLVNTIEYRLQYEYDKSLTLQCMAVFYKGFKDAFCKNVRLPFKKRKFIELYLYAQGIIYSNYITTLKNNYHPKLVFRSEISMEIR